MIGTGTEKTPPDRVFIPGRTALVGTANPLFPQDGEGPLRKVKIRPFWMDSTTVTVARFREFVAATGYETEAATIGWSFGFWSHLAGEPDQYPAVPGAPWWRQVADANWRHPNGPATPPPQDDHPVTQISWNDAKAFATWANGRLPTEKEWEHAARGGQGDVPYPWGDEEPTDHGPFPCNIWQGKFPDHNTGQDGYIGPAPARSFEPNGYGLYNMVGNVWEWTADPFRIKSLRSAARARASAQSGHKLLKGGSFLCHASYCHRYRIAARTGNSPDSATPHQGFRLVYDDRP